jgi:hypothetical protein
VPQPQEKTSDAIPGLPNPELNPLLNSTLGRNLGRWAQVYFTSPPEKREQAVVALLRELEGEAGAQVPEPEAGPILAQAPRLAPTIPEFVVCAECGHQNGKAQRFCGICGSPLAFAEPTFKPRAPENFATETSGAHRAAPEFSPQPTFPTLALFAQTESAPSPSRANPRSEIQWLRDKNALAGHTPGASRRPLKYIFTVLAVLLVGGFFYAQSRAPSLRTPGSLPGPAKRAAVENQARPNPDQLAQSRPTPSPASRPDTALAGPGVANGSRGWSAAQAGNGGARETTRTAANVQPEATNSFNNGALELAKAEDYLSGKKGPRDSAEAAKFLWKAVGKENTTATLLLSDLYLAGDGVPKSCDQARLLLNAAARKKVAEAAAKLRDLQTSGCP